MIFQGHIENGVVVFGQPVPLANGTPVRVEPVALPGSDFWQSHSLEELARQQGVPPVNPLEEIGGGWPDDEVDDEFDKTLVLWRKR